MDELIAFLRACLDTDQQHAEKDLYVLDSASARGEWKGHYGHNLPYSEVWADGGILFRVETPRHAADVAVIARLVKLARQRANDRLAEVEAKRRILDEAEQWMWNDDRGGPDPMAASTVRLLARPYAGRPGWRAEWVA